MPVQKLITYAKRNGLGQPGFGPKSAKFVLICDTEIGETPKEADFSVIELGDAENRRNPGLTFESCPETPGMNSGGKSHVLLETIEVVLGVNKTILKPEDKKSAEEKEEEEKLLAKHEFFVESLRQMASLLPEAERFVSFLEDRPFCEKIFLELTESKRAKISDKITLRARSIESESLVFLVNEERWRPWWVEYRKTLGKGGNKSDATEAESGDGASPPPKKRKAKPPKESAMISLATGEVVEPATTHEKITELGDVGAMPTGAVFIGFDKAALQSFGLDKSANAAMDETSAAEYRAAINDIFKNRSKRFGNVKIGYWFKEPVAATDDPVSMIEGPKETVKDEDDDDIYDQLNTARNLLNAWESGTKVKPTTNQYYSLILSGNAGRVMVRDWSSGSLTDWVEAANRWFSDTEIVRRDGSGIVCQHKFYAILGALLRDLTGKELDACSPMIVALWKAALNPNINIPESAVLLALRRNRIDMFGDKDGKSVPLNHARMGLLRAYLVRNEKDNNMSPYLNEDHPDTAYQCGRLMSLIADLQYAALGDVNAGVVQRFYSSASVSPQLVFGRLIRMCQFYLGKIDEKAGNAIEGRIAAVWGKIKDDIPATFSLKQQTLFAEGYYQEQARRRKEIADAKAAKVAKEENVALEE